jgi:hypothetical protein
LRVVTGRLAGAGRAGDVNSLTGARYCTRCG